LGLIRSQIEATATDMKRIQALYEKQLARVTDLYEIEARHAALLTQEIEQQNAAAVALEALRELAGGKIEQINPLQPDPTFPMPTQDVAEWVIIAQQNNHILKSYDYAISAAEKFIAEQWAEHLPTINASVTGTHSNTTFNNLQANTYDVGSLSLNVNVPLYQGGIIDAKRREAEYRLTAAKEKREEQGRSIEKETRTAYLKLQSGLSKLRSSQRQVRSSEKSYEAMRKGLTLNAVTVVDVLNAAKNLFDAKTKELEAKYDYIKNHIRLRYNAGVVSEQDIADVNNWLVKSR
jgi:outer membrane protein